MQAFQCSLKEVGYTAGLYKEVYEAAVAGDDDVHVVEETSHVQPSEPRNYFTKKALVTVLHIPSRRATQLEKQIAMMREEKATAFEKTNGKGMNNSEDAGLHAEAAKPVEEEAADL